MHLSSKLLDRLSQKFLLATCNKLILDKNIDIDIITWCVKFWKYFCWAALGKILC